MKTRIYFQVIYWIILFFGSIGSSHLNAISDSQLNVEISAVERQESYNLIERSTSDYQISDNSRLLQKLDEITDGNRAIINRLESDLASMTGQKLVSFKNFFEGNADGLNAWDLVRKAGGTNTLWSTDIPLLAKLSELSEDLTFMQRIGGEEGLEKVLKANVRARCKSCGNSGAAFLKHIDEYLDDVKHFVDNYYNVDGFNDVLNDLKLLNSTGSPNFNMEGAAFMLRVMKSNESTFLGKVSKFEGSIDDLTNGCRYDLTFTDGSKTIFGEFKSYGSNSLSSFLASNSATLQQLETYLGKINSIDELRYLFDVEKISDLSTIKSRFKTVFVSRADDWFKPINQGGYGLSKMKEIFENSQYSFNSPTQFKALLNNNSGFRDHVFQFVNNY